MNNGQAAMKYSTVSDFLMIERAIRNASDDLSKAQLFRSLPRKLNPVAFDLILRYMEVSGKIIIHRGKIVWVWDPKGIARIKREGLLIK